MPFSGKTVMITGAAVGIGRATAILMAEKGASLILLDIQDEKLYALTDQLRARGNTVLAYACDIADGEAVSAAVADSRRTLPRIDILVNNAALWRDAYSFGDIPLATWERYWAVNVMGSVHCIRAVLDGMVAQSYGRIINIASVAGVYGISGMAHYSATKGALIAMTRALAKEVTDKGVLVNCISPGSVSDSSDADIDAWQPSQLSFMGRTGTDRENANLVCFLAGDEATYISGQNIQIDGCRKKQ